MPTGTYMKQLVVNKKNIKSKDTQVNKDAFEADIQIGEVKQHCSTHKAFKWRDVYKEYILSLLEKCCSQQLNSYDSWD